MILKPMSSKRVLALVSSIFFLSCAAAPASDIFLKVDDNEFGQGILRPRNTECLIITPAHVVENGFAIEATTAEQIHAPAEIMELFPGDIAVLRLKSDSPVSCRRSSWPNHSTLNNLLGTEKEGELHTMLADGSMRKTPVEIVGFDKFRNIYIRPQTGEDALAKGFSGSPLFIGGQCAGMLLSVNNNGVGNVIRQDALANTLALFFEDSGGGGTSVAVTKKVEPPPAAPQKPGEQQFSGQILTNVIKEHSLRLQENSPIRINLVPSGDRVKYAIELVDSTHRISCSHALGGSLEQEVSLPCTPQRSDEFTLRVIGTGGEGRYQVQIAPLVADTALRNDNNILQVDGEEQGGTIAKGAVAEYRVKLFANSPVRLVQAPTTEAYAYQIEIADPQGSIAFRGFSTAKSDQTRQPFTPPKTDTYLLRVQGREGVGPYSIALQSIAFDAQLRGQANMLQLGGSAMRGIIAKGAVAEYRFALAAYTPAAFSFAATGDKGRFTAEIWDEQGTLVFRDPYRRFSGLENAQLPVTVSRAGNYTLRLLGVEGDTRYQCSLVPGR